MQNPSDNRCRFPSSLSEADFGDFLTRGDPWIFKKLGPRKGETMNGWSFSVWAPRAQSVSLVVYSLSDPPVDYEMFRIGSTGVWEVFLAEVYSGTKYKFHLKTPSGEVLEKADPMGVFSEGPPHNASILFDLDGFEWSDREWLEKRNLDWRDQPMSVYEVHPGSWRSPGNSYQELATELGDYVQRLGFTHVEFLPLNEHPLVESWGYQVTGYYGPNHRFGNPHDLMHLVDEFHRRGIGVILDWVPAHFPKDEFALGWFDGGHLFECEEEWKREHRDWGTWIFDYAKPEVRSFLMGSALAWLERYHVDGLRFDAVASMLYLDYSRGDDWKPNKFGGNENLEAIQFLQQTNTAVREYFPGVVTIAEESTAFPGVTMAQSGDSLGFHFKWNLGWMHDVLKFFEATPARRPEFFGQLLHCFDYQYSEDFIQVFSHDEVVHEKRSLLMKMGAGEGMALKAADLRTLFVLFWGWPGKKTLFMGGEFGQVREWAVNGILQWELVDDPTHRGLQELVYDLNHHYVRQSTLHRTDSQSRAFQCMDAAYAVPPTLSFLRWGQREGEVYLYVFNFGPQSCAKQVGVSVDGQWSSIINTADLRYGGDVDAKIRSQIAQEPGEEGHPYSLGVELTAHSAQVWQADR